MAFKFPTKQKSDSKPTPIDVQPRSQKSIQWEEVVNFLKASGFDHEYIMDTFQSEGFDRMEALFDLNAEDLKDMKIKRGHAKLILIKIEEYRTAHNPRRVRFGASESTPALPFSTLTMETIDEASSAQPPASPDIKTAKGNISVSSLMTPLAHGISASGSVEYSNATNRTFLVRTVNFTVNR